MVLLAFSKRRHSPPMPLWKRSFCLIAEIVFDKGFSFKSCAFFVLEQISIFCALPLCCVFAVAHLEMCWCLLLIARKRLPSDLRKPIRLQRTTARFRTFEEVRRRWVEAENENMARTERKRRGKTCATTTVIRTRISADRCVFWTILKEFHLLIISPKSLNVNENNSSVFKTKSFLSWLFAFNT